MRPLKILEKNSGRQEQAADLIEEYEKFMKNTGVPVKAEKSQRTVSSCCGVFA